MTKAKVNVIRKDCIIGRGKSLWYMKDSIVYDTNRYHVKFLELSELVMTINIVKQLLLNKLLITSFKTKCSYSMENRQKL